MKQQTKFKKTGIGKKDFIGIWHIAKMSEWDEEYCNMDVQAYIKIEKNRSGEFQFGLVTGSMYGGFKKINAGLIFDFTWEGGDECDEASGDGWMKVSNDETAEGEIRLHGGDKSMFWAKKA